MAEVAHELLGTVTDGALTCYDCRCGHQGTVSTRLAGEESTSHAVERAYRSHAMADSHSRRQRGVPRTAHQLALTPDDFTICRSAAHVGIFCTACNDWAVSDTDAISLAEALIALTQHVCQPSTERVRGDEEAAQAEKERVA